ncbi:MAG: autotransporter domain-containing protein [Fusobacteriaceae bacterium]
MGNFVYASFSKMEMDARNSINIRESGYAYTRKVAYEMSGNFQNFENESGDGYRSLGVTGGTFGKFFEEWIIGVGYGYVEAEEENFKTRKRELETLGGNIYLTRSSELFSVVISSGYTDGKNKVRDIVDSYNYSTRVINMGFELNSKYDYELDCNIYPYVGFDYSWGKDRFLDGMKRESPLGKVGVVIEKQNEDWLYSLEVAWLQNFQRKDYIINNDDVGSFRYSVENEIMNSIVLGVHYGGFLIEDGYVNRYGVALKYNW